MVFYKNKKDHHHPHGEHDHPKPPEAEKEIPGSLERDDLEEIFRREMGEDAEDLPTAEEFLFGANPKVAELEKALADEKERSLRILAELENYRRRSARELDDANKYRSMDVIREMLPVMDNLARAIEAAEKRDPDDPLLAGVRMVYQQFLKALENQKCVKMDALHQTFDPNYHQAIQQFASAEHPANTVICVAQDGFLLLDRVVRPAQVVVSK